MDYRYKHPLYTANDSELALNALIEYAERNNKAEQIAVQGRFIREIPQTPRDITRNLILTSYGCNIITMANYLNMQDLFFSKYMPHWLKYFDALGIAAGVSFMKASDFVLKYVIQQCIHRNMEPLTPWNPSIFWNDYSYRDDKMRNLANPLNGFYRASIHIPNCDNYDFIIAMDKWHNVSIPRDKGRKYNLDIKILPTINPINMIEITRIIHRYL